MEVFFTLSGFVIAYSAEYATTTSFVASRIGRLVPGTFICASVTALVCGFLHAASWRTLLTEWLDSAWLPVKHPFVDGSYWTLPIELSFYTIVLLLILAKAGKRVPSVMGWIGILSSLTWSGLTICHHFGDASMAAMAYHTIFILSTRGVVFETLLPHGCFFAEGVFLWSFTLKGPTRGRAFVCIWCAVGGVLETFWHSQLELASTGMTFGLASGSIQPCAVWILSVGCILAAVYRNWWITQRLNASALKAIRVAGLASYPLYLLHQRLGILALERMHGHTSDLLNLLIVLAVMLSLAVLVAVCVEPVLRQAILWVLRPHQPSVRPT